MNIEELKNRVISIRCQAQEDDVLDTKMSKELLEISKTIDKSNPEDKRSLKIIKCNLFYILSSGYDRWIRLWGYT